MIPKDLTPAILRGHVLDVLRTLPSDSVHCIVTSPPYWGLRAYGTEAQVWGGDSSHAHQWSRTSPRRSRSADDVRNAASIQAGHEGTLYEAEGGELCSCGAWRGELGLEPTPEAFVDHMGLVFDELRRVLRPDGTLWLNLGDTYATHPAGVTGAKRWRASTLANRDFTGHEQAGRMDKRAPGLKPKDLVGIPWRVAFELQRRGWWLRSDCVWAKPNPMPESVTDRPTRSHEYVFLLTKSGRYFYDSDAVRTPITEKSVRRYRAAVENRDRFDPEKHKFRAESPTQSPMSVLERAAKRVLERGSANLKTAWWIPTQPYREAHFATFPEAIPQLCIRAGTSERGCCPSCGAPWARRIRAEGGTIGHDWFPDKSKFKQRHQGVQAPGWAQSRQRVPGQAGVNGQDRTYRRVDLGFRPSCECDSQEPEPCVVLDPFAGSGTVLAVARRLGRRSVGIELKSEYVTLARKRCGADVPDLTAFEGVPA